MNDDLKQRVLSLDDRQWLLLLSRLAFRVTVLMRGCYPHVVNGTPPPDDYDRWQWLNELMHGITGQLAARMVGDSKRYPDEVHLASLFERAARADSVADINEAFDRILSGLT